MVIKHMFNLSLPFQIQFKIIFTMKHRDCHLNAPQMIISSWFASSPSSSDSQPIPTPLTILPTIPIFVGAQSSQLSTASIQHQHSSYHPTPEPSISPPTTFAFASVSEPKPILEPVNPSPIITFSRLSPEVT